MKSTSINMLEKSMAAMLSAIEIYNKPDFKYREESFVVLAVNAWELMLKAQILKNNKNKITSIYVKYENGRIKRTRSGNPMTLELIGSMKILDLDQAIEDNIKLMIEIRDTAIHFFHKRELKYVVFSLGSATIANYQRIIKEWFNQSLLKYNLFIMPFVFQHDFQRLKSMDLSKSPSVVRNIVKNVAEIQDSSSHSSYNFVCEIDAELISAKKTAKSGDVVVKIDPLSPEPILTITTVKSKLDQYPLSYKQLQTKIKSACPDVKPSKIDKVIKDNSIKSRTDMAAYSFRTKEQEAEFQRSGIIPKGSSSIYNDNAVKFIIDKII